ncbi:MAG: glycine cleavage T C-terminal barrel domain-containing protein [Terriglobales bacterium]|jgi:folate-binding protein YgfZ
MALTLVHGNPAPPPDFAQVHSEFQSLLSGCGFYDLSSRVKIALTGGDRVRWLNGMVTNNIRDLAAGRGVYAFLLNPQGHILGDLYAYNRGDSLMIDSDQFQSEKLLATFDHYIIMDDVEVTNVSDKLTAIGIMGPKSREVLRGAGFEIPNLEPLQFVDVNWRNVSMTMVRGDNESIECYELWSSPDQVTSVGDALTNSGAMPVGTHALELLRVAAGIPRYGQDIRERDLPQETEQQRALHFSKGCYIGQEIVERIRSRGNVHRKFTGFEVEGALPAVGAKIQADGRDIGEITSVASLPLAGGERSMALGYIRRELTTPGKQFQVGATRLSIANLPFSEVFRHEDL